MIINQEYLDEYGGDYVFFPGSAALGEVLRAYQEKDGQYWWLLVSKRASGYVVCSFGSLLPYVTGRTTHIIHNIGDCVICSAMDPLLWSETGDLVGEALKDEVLCARLVSELPMAEMALVEAAGESIEWADFHTLWVQAGKGRRAAAVALNGVFSGVYVERMLKLDLDGLPDF